MVVTNRLLLVEKIRIDANRLKGGAVKKRAKQNFDLVFGTQGFRLSWLIPIPEHRELTVEELYG